MEEKTELIEQENNSGTVASYTPLPNEVLIRLGFEKEPDGMFYERGWINRNINIAFVKTPDEKDFWETIANHYVNRGIEQYKQEFRELLGV